jgi:hypothetical protein
MKKLTTALFAALTSLIFAAPAMADEWTMLNFTIEGVPGTKTVAMNDDGVVCDMSEGQADCKQWQELTDLRKDSILTVAFHQLDNYNELGIVTPQIGEKVMLNVVLSVSPVTVSVDTATGRICILYNVPSCKNWNENSTLRDKILSEARNILIQANDPKQVFDVMSTS